MTSWRDVFSVFGTTVGAFLYMALLFVCFVWPLGMWWGIQFGGGSFAIIGKAMFIPATFWGLLPALVGDIILLLLPINRKIKIGLITLLTLPGLSTEIYFAIRIFILKA